LLRRFTAVKGSTNWSAANILGVEQRPLTPSDDIAFTLNSFPGSFCLASPRVIKSKRGFSLDKTFPLDHTHAAWNMVPAEYS
jgi:hypothetical protein